jgi:PIN domain nuclease of toxin-antitoxin system
MIAATANTVCVSAVSAWEIATKNRLGEWPDVERIVDEFPSLLRRSRFVPMAITVEHAVLAGSLAGAHRDPFDRMLIAQSREEKAALVSCDAVFRNFGVELIWA